MAEAALTRVEDMLDPREEGKYKIEDEQPEEMVNLRRSRRGQLDYSQLHKSGSKRTINRNVANISQDHGYCMKAEKYLSNAEEELVTEVRPEFRLGLFKNKVDKGEMENILGLSLTDWEKDPELAERMQSLGEVLGLAKDLNISVNGLDLNRQYTTGQDQYANDAQDYLDVPSSDFALLPNNNHSSSLATFQNVSESSDPKFGSQSSPIKRVRFDTSLEQKATTYGSLSQRSQSSGKGSRKANKRGRKPSKIDVKAKLERSRQSARECRARKKLRYQYLEELVSSRERSVFQLRSELEQFKKWAAELDEGCVPDALKNYLDRERERKERSQSESSVSSYVIRSRRRMTTDPTESESSFSSSLSLSVSSVQSPTM